MTVATGEFGGGSGEAFVCETWRPGIGRQRMILERVATAPGTDKFAVAWIVTSLLLPICQSQSEEILEKDSSVTRLVWMLPARRVLVPILERLFQMELHGINQLTVRVLDHHLIAAQI